MRLFLAVAPPPEVLDHLDLALAAVRRGRPGDDGAVRWTARETWHVTAAFYGEVPDGVVGPLADALRTALEPFTPYELALRGAGAFAHRTLWMGVGGDAEAQRLLAAASSRAGDDLGIRPDHRERARAHLTVGRVRPGSGPPARRRSVPRGHGSTPGGVDGIAGALAVYAGPVWTVSAVELIRSEPGLGRGGGPLYSPVARIVLGGRRDAG